MRRTRRSAALAATDAGALRPEDDPSFEINGFTRREWQMILPLSFTGFFENYDYALISIAAPVIYGGLGVSAARFAGAVAIIRLASLLAVPVLRLADRWGRRRMLLISLVAFTLAVGLTATAWSLLAFMAFQIPARIFLTTEGSLASLVVAEEVRADRRGRAMSLLGFISQIGFGFAALLIPIVRGTVLGWRLYYLIALAPLFVVGILRRNIPETAAFDTATAEDRVQLGWIPHIERRWWGRVLGAAMFFGIGGAVVTPAFFYAASLAQDTYGWTSLYTVIVIGSGVATFAGFLLGGRGSDVHGRRPIMRIGGVLGFVGMLVLFSGARWAYAPGWFLMAAGQACLTALALAYIAELVPTEIRATVTSFIVSSSVVGGSVGLAVSATVVPDHIAVAPLMRIFALVGFAALTITWFLPETVGTDVIGGFADASPDVT